MRPPVHRKLSVTATFGSVAVMPCASNACLMHSSLCREKFGKRNTSLSVECTPNTWTPTSLAEVSHYHPALHELLFPSRCFLFWSGNWASPDESLTGIALLGGMKSAFFGRLEKKNKLWRMMIFQHVGRVTSPCSLQVETSFRALLVSWVQGMQIGLKRISQTVWSHSKGVVLFT